MVGAGPAGTAAAIIAARAGLKTILIERGEYPGSKNVMGGVLYRHATAEIVPEFWKTAPLERPVVRQEYWMLTEGAAFTIGHSSKEFAQAPYNAFTVLRGKFDRWLGDQAVAAGALLITETVVEELLREDDRIIGVKTGREAGILAANVVILAEGVNALLAQGARLRSDIPAEHLAVAVKEIIAMPREKIEDRFGLEDGQGVAIELLGEATNGMVGTGFLYTNKDTVSIGVGALISQMVKREVNPNQLLERLKEHPRVKPLIADGEAKEYLAHMIPEGGYKAIPKLYMSGLLVAGDTAMLVNGLHREGSNLAMMSGKMAAETAIEAHRQGDFSAQTLAAYQKRLENSFVLQDLQKYQNATGFFEENAQFFNTYPRLVNELAQEFFTVDNLPKKEKQRIMWEKIRKERSTTQLIRDFYRLWRVLG